MTDRKFSEMIQTGIDREVMSSVYVSYPEKKLSKSKRETLENQRTKELYENLKELKEDFESGKLNAENDSDCLRFKCIIESLKEIRGYQLVRLMDDIHEAERNG